ncbi:hypothetical protein BHM03_00005659 [Ensete ventricosum]|nr:hypothetical protein BHM03_00005659 [Ensete ventricosum]
MVRSFPLVDSIKPINATIYPEINPNLLIHESRLCRRHLAAVVVAVFAVVAAIAALRRRRYHSSRSQSGQLVASFLLLTV